MENKEASKHEISIIPSNLYPKSNTPAAPSSKQPRMHTQAKHTPTTSPLHPPNPPQQPKPKPQPPPHPPHPFPHLHIHISQIPFTPPHHQHTFPLLLIPFPTLTAALTHKSKTQNAQHHEPRSSSTERKIEAVALRGDGSGTADAAADGLVGGGGGGGEGGVVWHCGGLKVEVGVAVRCEMVR